MAKTPTRTLRIDDELWEAAKAYAVKNGTNITRLLEAHLRDLVGQPAPPSNRKRRGTIRASGVVSKEGQKRAAEEEAQRASASEQQPPKSSHPNHSEQSQPRSPGPSPRAHHPGCSCFVCKPPKTKG